MPQNLAKFCIGLKQSAVLRNIVALLIVSHLNCQFSWMYSYVINGFPYIFILSLSLLTSTNRVNKLTLRCVDKDWSIPLPSVNVVFFFISNRKSQPVIFILTNRFQERLQFLCNIIFYKFILYGSCLLYTSRCV